MRIRVSCIAVFVAIGTVLSTPVHASLFDVVITETSFGGGPETLTVTTPGPLTGITIGGTTDNWTITIPGLNDSFEGAFPISWVEPGATTFNVLTKVGGTTDEFSYVSESPTSMSGGCGGPPPLALGASCEMGIDAAGNFYLAQAFETVSSVPEPTSVFLLATGCIAVGWRFRRPV